MEEVNSNMAKVSLSDKVELLFWARKSYLLLKVLSDQTGGKTSS